MRGVVVAALLCGCFSKPGPPFATDGHASTDGTTDGSGSGSACGWSAQVVDPNLDLPDMIEPAMTADTLDLIYRVPGGTFEATRTVATVAPNVVPWSVVGTEDATPVQLDDDKQGMWVNSVAGLGRASRVEGKFMLDGASVIPTPVADAAIGADNNTIVYVTSAGALILTHRLDTSVSVLFPAESDVTYASPALYGNQLVYSKVTNTVAELWSGTLGASSVTGNRALGISSPAASDTGSILFDKTLYFVRSGSPAQFMVATNSCN